MYVTAMDSDDDSVAPARSRNLLIRSQADIDALEAQGLVHIYVESVIDEESLDMAVLVGEEEEPAVMEDALAAAEPARSEPEIIDTAPFEEEIETARTIREEAVGLVREFMEEARSGRAIDTYKVQLTVEDMVDSIFRNHAALTSLARLKSFDEYTFVHSVNVAILAISVGRYADLSRYEIFELGMGAILHDIGKTRLPERLLNKPTILNDEEFREMKRHPELGVELLEASKDITETALDVANHHHERHNGSGYPGNLRGDDIHPFTRIVSVADVYDAMTSKRVYQRRYTPHETLRTMFRNRGKHFDPETVDTLVRCLGIFPIGSLVTLNTGEIAMVKSFDRREMLRPRVIILYDMDWKPLLSRREVDLRKRDDLRITGFVDPGQFGFNVDDIL
ncbi:MAG TPA: HD-GYP domain-containing protein [Deltaproteobacteria bacterium]|nr:HD-GYP domain-containing protein [Deltaproteobacteria bacterium]